MWRLVSLIGGITVFSFGVTASAASFVEFEVNDNGNRHLQTAIIDNGRVLIGGGTNQPQQLLFDANRNQFIVIRHDRRSYVVIDQPTVKRYASQATELRDSINQNLSSEQQQQLAGVLDSFGLGDISLQAPPPVQRQYVRSGDRRSVNGYPCEVYRITQGGKTESIVCTTSESALRLPGNDYQALRAMYVQSSQIASHARGLPLKLIETLPDLGGHEIEGLPVAYSSLAHNITVALRRMRQGQAVPASLQVPEGYRQLDLLSLENL
jgi:hypothetical protein